MPLAAGIVNAAITPIIAITTIISTSENALGR
jgi:hypothetical protein